MKSVKALVIDVKKHKQYRANMIEELAESAGIDAKVLNEFTANDFQCYSG